MTLSVNEARFGYNHVTSQDAANENMSIVGPGVYLDPLYGSKCAMSFSSANSLVIGTGAVWANGHYVTIKSPKTVSIANGQSGYKRNDIVCIHCHIDDFGQESATESYELVVKQGTQTTGTPDDPVIVNDAISDLVEDSYAPIARVKLEGLVPTVEPLMTMLPALMDLITTGRIENKAVTKAKLADHCVGQQQLETSVWDSISQTREVTISSTEIAANNGNLVRTNLPTILGYKAVGVVGMKIGMSLYTMYFGLENNNTRLRTDFLNRTSTAFSGSPGVATILYLKDS